MNSDIMVANANFMNRDKDLAEKYGHLTVAQAAKIASQDSVKKLYIQHVSSRYKNTEKALAEAQEIFQNTYLGEDLLFIQ